MLKIGEKAPDFTLPAAIGGERKEITLSKEYATGDVVLAFYPIAFSGVCTQEVCDLRDQLSTLTATGSKVIGFSVDPLPVNVAFQKVNNLTYPLVSDHNSEVVEKIWQTMTVAGVHKRAKRGVVVIGKDGVVKYVNIQENPGEWQGLDAVKKALVG